MVFDGDGEFQCVFPIFDVETSGLKESGSAGEKSADFGIKPGSLVLGVRSCKSLLNSLFKEVCDGFD